jgi:23S rRNA (cytidine2498-2'-O)-methyltransferase
MDLLLCAPDEGPFLLAELARRQPGTAALSPLPGLVEVRYPVERPSLPWAFARQLLPDALPVSAPSIRRWADLLAEAVIGHLPDAQPWRLHLLAGYGIATAGAHRCELITAALEEVLQKRRRHLLRHRVESHAPFNPSESLVQLVLTGLETGVLSVAPAPLPHSLRASISPFLGGWIPSAVDKTAPSRAFAKLAEAEHRLGRWIQPDERCIDLGACPGSWTWLAIQRGAHVLAVDRSPVREDLLHHPRVQFQTGDAFKFVPSAPVDWLVCDVIAAPERSIGLACDWVTRRWAKHLVVTVKFKGQADYAQLDRLLELAPACREFRLARLCANKNEACFIGTLS